MATAAPPACLGKAAPSPSAPLYDTMVIVKVGKQKQEFFAHKGLICHYSTYFRAAFQGQFQEGITGVVELAKDSVEFFKIFFGWMYTGRLFEPPSEPGKIPLESTLLAKIYVFGDARGIPDLKNAAIDALFNRISYEWSLPTLIIPYVYANTLQSSPLRRFVVDMVVCGTYESEGFRDPIYKDNFTTDYLRDLAVELYDLKGARPRMSQEQWRNRDRCQYHDHSNAPAAETT